MFHDSFHDEDLWSKIAVMIVESRAPDKHEVSAIGAGYILIVTVCNSRIYLLVYNFIYYFSNLNWNNMHWFPINVVLILVTIQQVYDIVNIIHAAPNDHFYND